MIETGVSLGAARILSFARTGDPIPPPDGGRPASVAPQAPNSGMLPVFCMALGTFAIGTEGFMIAPLLPEMAGDFLRPISSVALLVTVFTLTLAISSPILTVLTARFDRRRLLISTMVAFAIANLVAWSSQSFTGLLIARVMLAVAAGLYIPNANALAGAIVKGELRGRALAIVSGGMTIAIALGLPLGAMIGHAFGWRATFFAVGVMAAVAAIGIMLGLENGAGGGVAVPGFRQRAQVAGEPAVLKALSVSAFWSIGAFIAYPFIAPYLASTLGFGVGGISASVSLWGVSAAAGVVIGGYLNDKLGSARVIAPMLLLLALSFLVLSASNGLLSPTSALIPVLLAIALWGLTVWGFFPAQMAHLIAAGGLPSASVTLSLNTSVMYAGFAVGSSIGSVILANDAIAQLGMVAAMSELVALALFLMFRSRAA
ncbi:MFS transporter [Tardiphaga sp. P9-11]|nr:MFS transporter [Tardiphaga sp. P9-11]